LPTIFIGGAIALALTSLLACSGCPPSAPEVTESRDPVGSDDAPACTLESVTPLPGSTGDGPVAVTAWDGGVAIAYQGTTTDGPNLQLRLLSPSLELADDPATLIADEAGPLLAEAVGRAGSSIVVVGRQLGGRRVHFFGESESGFEHIESGTQEVLDRRTSVRVVEPRAGSGLQFIRHVSGTPALGLGRIAGGLLVSRDVEVSIPLVEPAATAAPAGALAVAFVTAEGSGRHVHLIELAADGSSERSASVADLTGGWRTDRITLDQSDGAYHVLWSAWQSDRLAIHAASIDEARLQPGPPERIFISGNNTIPTVWDALLDGDGALTVWVEQHDQRSFVWAEIGGRGTLSRDRAVIETLDGARVETLTLRRDGERSPVLAWRQVPTDESVGQVIVGRLNCR